MRVAVLTTSYPRSPEDGAGRFVADAVERIRPAAEQAGIAVVVGEVDPALAILGDRRQLVSALYNLLDNAVKYSDEGDDVQVRAVAIGTSVGLEVQDHGIGIPKADLERVFERFYRVDQARSRSTGGTGLGLAIVRHVATNHDGEVKVDSRLGEGSTFTLIVPAAEPRSGAASPSPGVATPRPSGRSDRPDRTAAPDDQPGRSTPDAPEHDRPPPDRTDHEVAGRDVVEPDLAVPRTRGAP
jgi:two-component system sensor histidine kinase SenX3